MVEKTFPKNYIGQYIFTVTGTGLTIAEWLPRLINGGHHFTVRAANLLARSDYDNKHRLEKGREYRLALMRSSLTGGEKRIVDDLKAAVIREVGSRAVQGLKAEVIFLLREQITNMDHQKMGRLHSISTFHEPITDIDGEGRLLNLATSRHGSCIGTHRAQEGFLQNDTAFAVFAQGLQATAR